MHGLKQTRWSEFYKYIDRFMKILLHFRWSTCWRKGSGCPSPPTAATPSTGSCSTAGTWTPPNGPPSPNWPTTFPRARTTWTSSPTSRWKGDGSPSPCGDVIGPTVVFGSNPRTTISQDVQTRFPVQLAFA